MLVVHPLCGGLHHQAAHGSSWSLHSDNATVAKLHIFTQFDAQPLDMMSLTLLVITIKQQDFQCLAYNHHCRRKNNTDNNNKAMINSFHRSWLLILNHDYLSPPAGTSQESIGLNRFSQTCRLYTLLRTSAHRGSIQFYPLCQTFTVLLINVCAKGVLNSVLIKIRDNVFRRNHSWNKELVQSKGQWDTFHNF